MAWGSYKYGKTTKVKRDSKPTAVSYSSWKTNHEAGNTRAGDIYRTRTMSDGSVYHIYPAEQHGLGREVYRVKAPTNSAKATLARVANPGNPRRKTRRKTGDNWIG